MRIRSGGRVLSWMALSLFLLLTQLYAKSLLQKFYASTEVYFSSPISVSGSTITLRSDPYGKGHFGASRNGGRRHKGIDILAPVGGEVRAPKSGRVLRALEEKGYGKWVEILHPDGLITRYAHLSLISISVGDWVSKGQLLGLSGKSGNASNPHIIPHLHFEIRHGSQALNPSLGLLDPGQTIVNK